MTFSCRKAGIIEGFVKEPLVDQVRVEFRRDSIGFYSTFDVQKYNFRQSLSRIIHWDRAREKTDTVIVPITLKLPDGEINAATGDATLRHKVFLIAYKKSGSGYTYKMLTYIGDAVVSLKEFSGTVYYEDYFEGRVKYKTYDRGYPLDTRHDRLSPYNRVASMKSDRIASGMDCNWTKVATVCVGDPQNLDAPFVCNDRYEYQCTWNRDSFPDIEDEVDDSDSGEMGGGSSGSGNTAAIIDSLQGYPCAQALLQQLPNLKNDIAELILDRFGGDSDFDVLFQGFDLKQYNSGLDGKAFRNSAYFYTVRLDSTLLKKATKEYILATMYHEVLHAYLFSEQVRLGKSQFAILYGDFQSVLIDGSVKYKSDHVNMSRYINDIASAIRSFNPNFPSDAAIALAKYGITNSLSNYETVNNNERSGSPQATGTKCSD